MRSHISRGLAALIVMAGVAITHEAYADCPPGWYDNGTGVCVACDPGSFGANAPRIQATGACTDCAAGTYSSQPGAADVQRLSARHLVGARRHLVHRLCARLLQPVVGRLSVHPLPARHVRAESGRDLVHRVPAGDAQRRGQRLLPRHALVRRLDPCTADSCDAQWGCVHVPSVCTADASVPPPPADDAGAPPPPPPPPADDAGQDATVAPDASAGTIPPPAPSPAPARSSSPATRRSPIPSRRRRIPAWSPAAAAT